jgi:ABC-type branched-subunit amino acid transport system ATPase component/branched-subunit amino acid ABC-type transport system permease component
MDEVIQFALLGIGLGALYSLASQGLVLIYRGSGVLNFAHGAIGIAGAYAKDLLQHSAGFPLWAALILGIGASATLGALTHLLVMRPLRRASPLSRIVATLGVLITVQSGMFLIYQNVERYWTRTGYAPSDLPATADDNIHLWGDVVIQLDRLIMLCIAGAMSVLLWYIYRHTKFGLATTAVAENQRAAASLGKSPDLIATVNWAAGSALAGLAGILVAPIVTLQVGTMTNLMLGALAAALVASFTSFPVAFFSAVAIGIAQVELQRYNSTIGDWLHFSLQGFDRSVPFIVIVLVLAFRGQAIPLRDFFLQRLPSVGSGRVNPVLVLGGIGVCSLLFLLTPAVWVDSFTVMFSVALILLSVVVVTGYGGQISLAQYAIAGFGAWAAGRLVAAAGFPFWAALIVGVLATVPLGVLFALPAVRTRGVALAVVTLGLGTALELILFANGKYTGGFLGTSFGETKLFGWSISSATHVSRYAFFVLGCFVVAALAVSNVRRGRSGRRLLAVRTNERAAAALGINVPGAKLYAFGLSAAIAALGGITVAFAAESIDYSKTFTNFVSITDVGYAFIGGIGYLMGPVIGATLAPGSFGARLSETIFSDGAANYVTFAGGIILILLVLQNQHGIAREMIAQFRWVRSKIPLPPMPRLWQRKATVLPPEKREPVRPMALEVDGVTVRYGAVVAVDDVSLRVEPGKVVGLIGPNGAGKTTFIDAVTGFTAPSAGTIRLDGIDVGRWSASRRARGGLSRSFQSLELFGDATVLDNLRAASDPRDTLSYVRDLVYPVQPQLPGEVVAAIKEFKLEDDLDRHVDDLAYGQRRLLAIARAVATQPSVLLLDEPAAGLGDVESAELAHLVRRLADDWGMGVLVVEHDMSFVMSVCDEIVVLDFGKKISEGTPDHVRNDPTVIAAYLGDAEDEDDDHPPASIAATEREDG